MIEAALKDCVHQTCRKPPPPKSIHNVRFLKMEEKKMESMQKYIEVLEDLESRNTLPFQV